MKAIYPQEGCIEYESDRVIFKVWEKECKILWREGVNWCELEQTFRLPVSRADLDASGALSSYLAQYDAQHGGSDLRLVLEGSKSFREAMKPA